MAPKKEAAPVPPGVQRIGEENSLGVDIHGLAALANKLYSYVPPAKEIVNDLRRAVRKLVTDAGWKGDDANRFEDAWGVDAANAEKLSMFIEDVAGVLDNLATSLSELQLALNERMISLKGKETGKFDKLALWKDAITQSNKVQAEAAKRLVTLYAGNKEWSVLAVTKSLSKDKNIDSGLRKSLGDLNDELDDHLPDNDFDWSGFLTWAGTGAGIGGVIGSPFAGVGAIPGSVVGGSAGLLIGGGYSSGKWAIDQLDDWF
ncbi:hypothetical protein [Actinomadura sp. 6N118]|uniref:hypothetical protein n=1 Tax=Actinomadura sp. 6N118 TaxID=3375151 RepID=UPI00378AE0A2